MSASLADVPEHRGASLAEVGYALELLPAQLVQQQSAVRLGQPRISFPSRKPVHQHYKQYCLDSTVSEGPSWQPIVTLK